MTVADHMAEFTGTVTLIKSLRTKANDPNANISAPERFLLYEAIFLRVFRAYENLLEETFVSYLVGEQSASGNAVPCFVTPRDRDHARAIVTSSQPFLDWTSPPVVITRSETYINGGDPVRSAITASQQYLQIAKKLRNHIAHNSRESTQEFRKVVQEFLLTLPVQLPSAGELLAQRPARGPANRMEVLEYFIEKLESTAKAIVEHP